MCISLRRGYNCCSMYYLRLSNFRRQAIRLSVSRFPAVPTHGLFAFALFFWAALFCPCPSHQKRLCFCFWAVLFFLPVSMAPVSMVSSLAAWCRVGFPLLEKWYSTEELLATADVGVAPRLNCTWALSECVNVFSSNRSSECGLQGLPLWQQNIWSLSINSPPRK